MKIQVETLSNGIHEYKFVVLPEEIFSDDLTVPADLSIQEVPDFQHPIYVAATIEKNTRHVYLKVSIHTIGKFQCDRCVEYFENEIDNSYEAVYRYQSRVPFPLQTGENDDFIILDENNPIIDLSEDVRQTLLLSVPMKLLCKESCAGLCSHCGTNLNEQPCDCISEIDERWNSLVSLKRNN
ncbi:MAG: DUF177 domain-containing protein [Ignavibacteria bacterium]|nr:DUF177 domain-containing protein [Ignavibacteria bacterium]